MLATLLIHRLCNAEVSCSTAEFDSSKGVTSAIKFCDKLCSVSCQPEKRGCASCVLAAVLVVVLVAVLVVY